MILTPLTVITVLSRDVLHNQLLRPQQHSPCCPYASTHNTVHWAYNVRVCEGRSGSLFLHKEGHQETQGLNPIWVRQRARNGLRSLSIAITSRSIEKALWSSWDPLEAVLLHWRIPA